MRDLKTGKCPLQAGDDLKRQSQPPARILGRSYNHGSVFRQAIMMRLRPAGLYVHYTALPWTYLRYHISISRRSPPQTERELHSATTGFNRDLLLTKAPSEPCTSAIRPKKKGEKNRGMPHLEEESSRTRGAAIAIGRGKSPKKTTNREPNMNM